MAIIMAFSFFNLGKGGNKPVGILCGSHVFIYLVS